MFEKLAVIVSTYKQPEHLKRCLFSLCIQYRQNFEIVIADDGSGDETRRVIDQFMEYHTIAVKHVWQEDLGFRKARILNRAVAATDAEYLVFIDGDCVAHPDFLAVHEHNARLGHYLSGSRICLNEKMTERLTMMDIAHGRAFFSWWLLAHGMKPDRRLLRLSLGEKTCAWLDRHTITQPHWLGCNASCFRTDYLRVDGVDEVFSYGFEDGDFGIRLENAGVKGINVRWRANVLHLDHGRSYATDEVKARNYLLVTPRGDGQRFQARRGLSAT